MFKKICKKLRRKFIISNEIDLAFNDLIVYLHLYVKRNFINLRIL